MINTFWYDGQLRKYMAQFMSIFSGMHVQNGFGECAVQTMTPVPIVAGFKDRVVAAIGSGNTQNRMFGLPIMACQLQSLAIDHSRRRAPGSLDTRQTMDVGGVFPNDLRTVNRLSPVPYTAMYEVSVYASNTQQLHQILEQILVLFNPDLQLDISTGAMDWTRITKVVLQDVSNEENYPIGTDRRIVCWSLTFAVDVWLSIPASVHDNIVQSIQIKLSEMDKIGEGHIDEDGIWWPFGTPIATIEINSKDPVGPDNQNPKQYNDKPPYLPK